MNPPDAGRAPWSMVRESLSRPYPVSVPMVVFVLLVPFYIFIAELAPEGTLHVPESAFDHLVPVQAGWAIVYGALYLFLILLPIFVVRQEEQIRRTVWAYLAVWITAYIFFLAYPTMAQRPPKVMGEGFVAWGLRFLYSADPPYNCFPSLHVAHSCVSALTCHRVHRGVGTAAALCALLVGASTLFTKQHYVADVVAGILLASMAYAVFLRSYPREAVPELDRRVAPVFALGIAGGIGFMVAGSWLAYLVLGEGLNAAFRP